MNPSVVSSVLPFPNILWWCHSLNYNIVIWDLAEHFEKMSFRNRYEIATANGRLKMTVPLKNGRDQKVAMNELEISYAENWQKQHWRTLLSAYNRSPYFEYYAPSLEELIMQRHEKLKNLNLASYEWLKLQLGLNRESSFIFSYESETNENVPDLRLINGKNILANNANFPTYYQVFAERNGFLPNLSLLDLLFAEGPHTLSYVKQNSSKIIFL